LDKPVLTVLPVQANKLSSKAATVVSNYAQVAQQALRKTPQKMSRVEVAVFAAKCEET
jgi:hypothetical protein